MKTQCEKRILSFALAFLLCVSFFPAQVFAEGEESQEEPNPEGSGCNVEEIWTDPSEEEELPCPVSVSFLLIPEDTALLVYVLDENGEKQEITPDEYGVYYLLPGEYYYDAAADGCNAQEEVWLFIEEGAEPQEISVELTAVPAEDELADTDSAPDTESIIDADSDAIDTENADDTGDASSASAAQDAVTIKGTYNKIEDIDALTSASVDAVSQPTSKETKGWPCYATVKTSKGSYTAVGLMQSEKGWYWYKLSGGKYLLSNYVNTVTLKYDGLSVSMDSYPKGTRHVGDSLTLKGTVKSSTLPMDKVGCFVFQGSDQITGGWSSSGLNAKSFSIKGTTADTKCKLGSVPAGDYVFKVKVYFKNCYVARDSSGKDIVKTETKTIHEAFTSNFTEAYKVKYNANGGTGSTVPGDQWKYKGKTLTLQSAYPSRSDTTASRVVTFDPKDGSCSTQSLSSKVTTKYTFARWNTNAAGSGTSYNPGGNYTDNKDLTLYAQWTSSTSASSITLPSASKTDYDFLGWAASKDASAASYYAGEKYTPSAAQTLYAVYAQKQTDKYRVDYNANGGTGAPGSQYKTQGKTLTLSATKPAWSGHTFLGWAESASATSAQYQPGGNYTKDAAVTLYAVWKVITYPVIYNANEGTGAPANQTKTHGTPLTLSTTKPTRTDYNFLGWAESASATSAQYQPGDLYCEERAVTLYAIWNHTSSVTFTDVSDPTAYYYNPVYWALDNGITTGTSSTTFSPYDNCTREQIVTFLWRAAGSPEPTEFKSFTDVPGDTWYSKAISWAAQKGITTGYADGSGRFGVGDPCTREQSVTFLWRAAGKPAPAGGNNFTDMAPGAYYVDAVSWAAENGITTGLNDGTGRFGVGMTCSRAMIVTFLYRYNNAING